MSRVWKRKDFFRFVALFYQFIMDNWAFESLCIENTVFVLQWYHKKKTHFQTLFIFDTEKKIILLQLLAIYKLTPIYQIIWFEIIMAHFSLVRYDSIWINVYKTYHDQVLQTKYTNTHAKSCLMCTSHTKSTVKHLFWASSWMKTARKKN